METEDKSCKTPRWRSLKAQLNNLAPLDFFRAIQSSVNRIVIDVRTPEEFEQGHLAGANNISYFADDFWERMEALKQKSDYQFFVYCRSGRRSIRVCTLMRNGGFDNALIFNMDGGYQEWLEVQNNSRRN